MTHPSNDPLQQAGQNEAPAKKSRNTLKLVVVLVLVAAAVVFIVQNTNSGTVNFLWMSITMPYWIWFTILLVVGVVIGSIFPWFRPRKKAVKK